MISYPHLYCSAPPTSSLPCPPHARHDDAVYPSQLDVDLKAEVGQGLEVDLCQIADLHTLCCHTNLCVTHMLHFCYVCVCVCIGQDRRVFHVPYTAPGPRDLMGRKGHITLKMKWYAERLVFTTSWGFIPAHYCKVPLEINNPV